jgi:hypothetical protein
MGRVLVAAFPQPCVPNRTSNSAGMGKFLKYLLFVIPGPRASERSPESITPGHGVPKRGNSTAPAGLWIPVSLESRKNRLASARNDAEGEVLRACKNATLRRICCGAIVEPRGGTYYRVISVRPMRGDSETSPGRPTEPGRGFLFASTPPIPVPRQSVGAGFKPAPTISPLARRVFFSPLAPVSANDSRTQLMIRT